MDDDSVELVLPSAGPDPLPLDTAVAAVLGYARGRRPLYFRAPNARTGRWVEVPAFGYERFDARPGSPGPLGEADILTAEGLHGRLDPAGWAAMRAVLDDVAPLADAALARAAGRSFPELPDDEFSVLAEPGTVGGHLRRIEQLCAERPGVPAQHVAAALHSRRPSLFPLLDRTTRWQLLPHVREGDSGVAAVVSREIRANRAALGLLQERTAELLDGDPPLTVLRLHDVVLWLSGSLRLTHAVALGRRSEEWWTYRAAHPRSRPV
ncbi:MAG: DUF6308 family protein [Actinomycetes bacterium]